MLTPNFWFVQYILMGQSGELALILCRRNCGNQTIPKVMIPRWKQNVDGIPFLQVNVLNAAPHFQGWEYPQSNGAVSVVAGKMIYKLFGFASFYYSLRSFQISRPLTLLIVSSTATEAAIISRSSPPRYKRPKLPTATIPKILIDAAFSASLPPRAA